MEIQKLYNPLAKLVRRIKRFMMTNLIIAFGVMMIPIGFSLLGLYFIDPNHNGWLRNLGLLSGVIGFIAIWKAIDRAKAEDDIAKKEREKAQIRHEELLKAFNKPNTTK